MPSETTVMSRLEMAGVPSRYLSAEPRPDLLSGAYLFGPVGCGKTHAACGAMRAYVQAGFKSIDGLELYLGGKAAFVSVPRWFAMLRATYDTRGSSEDAIFRKYAMCDFLVLDDLGKGGTSEWAAERLYMLVDERYANNRKTIITSNYDVGKVASMLSTDPENMQAVASRIMGLCPGVRMDGEDLRKKI